MTWETNFLLQDWLLFGTAAVMFISATYGVRKVKRSPFDRVMYPVFGIVFALILYFTTIMQAISTSVLNMTWNIGLIFVVLAIYEMAMGVVEFGKG